MAIGNGPFYYGDWLMAHTQGRGAGGQGQQDKTNQYRKGSGRNKNTKTDGPAVHQVQLGDDADGPVALGVESAPPTHTCGRRQMPPPHATPPH